MRRPAILAAIAFAGILLAGCASTTAGPAPIPSDGCLTINGIRGDVCVTGNFGAQPAVSVKAPVNVTSTTKQLLVQGSGDAVTPDDLTSIDFTIYDATTGKAATATPYGTGSGTYVLAADGALPPGIVTTLQDSHVGDRVAGVISPDDAFGDQGYSEVGINGGDTIVFVADILGVTPTHATGADQPAPEGFPTVALAADGTPTVTIPSGTPPADTKIAVLKKGTGDVVKAGDDVWVQYQGVNWRTGQVFDQSWGRSPTDFTTNAVIPGFTQALVGQAVGSQVIAVIAPKDGYGPSGGNAQAGINADDTLVFVVDILATQSSSQQ